MGFPADSLHSLFDELAEEDFATAEVDLQPYARASNEEDPAPFAAPASGIRQTLPTLSREVGTLPNEPEEDSLLRCFGCGARVLSPCVAVEELPALRLEPRHAYVLSLLGGTSIWDVLDASALSREETLCVLEELLVLDVVR